MTVILFGMAKKILTIYMKFFAVWVLLFGVIAYYFPEPFKWISGVVIFKSDVFNLSLLSAFFALTMFGIGAVLQLGDFKRIAANPVVVLIGVCAQFTIMPLGAFVIARAFKFPTEIAAGLIVTGCAPGAMASNVMTYISKADTAYSVSLTSVSTILCPILTPMLTLLLSGSKLEVGFVAMFVKLLVIVVFPLMAGFLIRHFLKDRIEKIVDVFPAISVTFIILICATVVAGTCDDLPKLTGPILIAGVILNLYGMCSGYGVGALFRMENKRRRTLAIEIGMQNAGLGMLLAKEHISDTAAIPAAMFVFLCIFTASIMAEVWQRSDARSEKSTIKAE